MLKSFNTTNETGAIWQMGAGTSWYPDNNGQVQENFGRATGSLITGLPGVFLKTNHLYNVMSKANAWTNRFNNVDKYGVGVNTVGFSSTPRIGYGGSHQNMLGFIYELMIFNRELTAAERDTLATVYFKPRYNLW